MKEQAFSRAGPLYGFTNHLVEVKDSITLLVTLGDDEHTTTKYFQFYVVDHLMPYNAIFRRPVMRMARMITATFCMKIKFLAKTKLGFLRPDQRTMKQCHMLSVKQAKKLVIEGQSSQKAELASQALDLNSLDIGDDYRTKKPEATKHTETL
ncbi:hypothetical protein J1N35_019657 [Gossypium stocksii]|uniref:Uncharacterized protein n=1 Tax=Gossypium stocksii TaxID=47602 RepID=A0A9D3VST0_9ROSI|nr:hypothetical protein J1N35_019657 [Gossypium stocksii]